VFDNLQYKCVVLKKDIKILYVYVANYWSDVTYAICWHTCVTKTNKSLEISIINMNHQFYVFISLDYIYFI